jgi:hypothetical protein
MAHYAIMRGEKRKTGDVRGMTAHIARSQPTPNADASQQHRNYAVVGPAWDDQKGINDAIEARTPAKYRKDAVRAIEYIVSASPDWFEQNSEKQSALYFEHAVDWFQDEFGADNVVSAVVHNDESSPHMHILVVPLDAETGRLNGKWFFGNKGVLQKRQTRFADHMSPFGVERGKADPERSHTKVSEWRAGHAKLDERQREVSQSASKLRHREISLADRADTLDELEKSLELRLGGLKHREAQIGEKESALEEQNARLSILKREIEERESTLKMSEETLKERENSINNAGKALNARLAEFERKQSEWIASNKPPGVPDLVLKLRKMQHMSTDEARIFVRNEPEAGDYWNPIERRLMPEAQELLDQYGEAAEKVERWERTFTAPSSGPGL